VPVLLDLRGLFLRFGRGVSVESKYLKLPRPGS
jgi:hypothetical protein